MPNRVIPQPSHAQTKGKRKYEKKTHYTETAVEYSRNWQDFRGGGS